jgi:hypothetical protein
MPYLKGLNSKFPFATDFLMVCKEVTRLSRERNFLNPFKSGAISNDLVLIFKL